MDNTTPGPVPAFEVFSAVVETSKTLGKWAAAMAKAQGMMTHASAGATNAHFNHNYADLSNVLDACREPLSVNEIARFQAPLGPLPSGEVGVKTMLIHSSDEWVASIVWCKPKDAGPQALGTVISYLRRYGLAAAAGLAQRDDDGESGEGRGKKGGTPEPTPPARSKAAKPAAAEAPSVPSPASARTPAPWPANVAEGQAPVFLFRNAVWEDSGIRAAIVTKEHHARVKILQKELGIPDANWRERLAMRFGKDSSTRLTDAEAVELAGALEQMKAAKTG